jgi:hypothetical protein
MWYKKKMFRPAIILFLIISLVSLACNFGLSNRPPATPSASGTPQSTDNRDGSDFEFLPSDDEHGRVELIFDESDITDIVAAELQDVEGTSISDVQVFLREGQVQVFGKIQVQGVGANSRIFLVPQITRQGQIRFVIVSAYYSLFPIPDDMISKIQTSIDELFSGYLEPLMTDVTIESVSVSEGLMTITGREN